MLTKENQISGLNRLEGIIQVKRLLNVKGMRMVEIRWIKPKRPLLLCAGMTDDEWDLFEKAKNSDKQILIVSSLGISLKKMKSFHDVYMEIIQESPFTWFKDEKRFDPSRPYALGSDRKI